ncbi:MAG TPA: AbfB domain-containing protein, partial [Umezawaea sp.]|nr:AbfB domain-containing protein [Umezawaea sp.]
DVVNDASAALLKSDATFIVRRGLANSTCYSFESRNYPGRYLRHADFRVRLATNENTDLFRLDATFCAQPGTGGVRFASANELGTNMRHYAEAVYVASSGGAHVYDSPSSYDQDVSWAVSNPWAP